ncbi:hypothetical protein HHI36_015668 [Cryptolaemus montrouzieri]|uniref:Odorant receptor n=1 Tax=Cryptolaemus montrouzieri TaxID=559131 RepID=A0ABD2N6W9_9CUCU
MVRKASRDCEFHKVGGTHHVHLNEPDKVGKLVNNFLEKHHKFEKGLEKTSLYMNREDNIKSIPILLQCGSKMNFLFTKKEAIRAMLLKTKRTLSEFNPPSVNKIGKANMERVSRLFKFYMLTILFSVLQFNTSAYIRRIPFILTYKENEMSDSYWRLIYLADMNFLFFISGVFVGCNWLFLFFVAHVVSEMKMLNKMMSKSSMDPESRDFRILVDYHSFILSLIKDIEDNYSGLLLGEYVLNLLSACFCLFMWTIDGLPPDLEHTTRYLNLAFNFLVALGLFCYAGNALSEQCKGVANIIFYKMMEKQLSKNNKLASIMMIRRSQLRTSITFGKFFDLNMETFYDTEVNKQPDTKQLQPKTIDGMNMTIVETMQLKLFFEKQKSRYV